MRKLVAVPCPKTTPYFSLDRQRSAARYHPDRSAMAIVGDGRGGSVRRLGADACAGFDHNNLEGVVLRHFGIAARSIADRQFALAIVPVQMDNFARAVFIRIAVAPILVE